MEGYARIWFTPKQKAELWERWKSCQCVADIARRLRGGTRVGTTPESSGSSVRRFIAAPTSGMIQKSFIRRRRAGHCWHCRLVASAPVHPQTLNQSDGPGPPFG